MQWNEFKFRLLPSPQHDERLLPALQRTAGGTLASLRAAASSQQIVQEFRWKMRVAEELITKLAFSLREIQGLRERPRKKLSLGALVQIERGT
jgi:hypothetical protein